MTASLTRLASRLRRRPSRYVEPDPSHAHWPVSELAGPEPRWLCGCGASLRCDLWAGFVQVWPDGVWP